MFFFLHIKFKFNLQRYPVQNFLKDAVNKKQCFDSTKSSKAKQNKAFDKCHANLIIWQIPLVSASWVQIFCVTETETITCLNLVWGKLVAN